MGLRSRSWLQYFLGCGDMRRIIESFWCTHWGVSSYIDFSRQIFGAGAFWCQIFSGVFQLWSKNKSSIFSIMHIKIFTLHSKIISANWSLQARASTLSWISTGVLWSTFSPNLAPLALPYFNMVVIPQFCLSTKKNFDS